MFGIDTSWVVDPRKTRGCCHVIATMEGTLAERKSANAKIEQSKYFGPERNRRDIRVLKFHRELVCSSKVPTRSIRAQFGIVPCLTA